MKHPSHRWLPAGIALLALLSPTAYADEGVKNVRCDRGESLASATAKARPGDTLRILGTCLERVAIATDKITLDGQGSAIVDGGGGGPSEFTPVITIDGARGVTVKGLTVQHGPGEGILGRRGATFTVQSVVSRNHALTGIVVSDGSNGELVDVELNGNALGMDVYTNSSAILRGAIRIHDNLGNGVEINGKAVVELRGAQVKASNNGGVGVVVGSGQLALFGFAATAGSTLESTGNGFAGIIVAGSLFTVYPPSIVTTSNNGAFGIFFSGGAVLGTVPGGGAKFIVQDNGVGLRFQLDSSASFQGGQLTVTGNGVGLQGDGAGTLAVLSEAATPSIISGNGLDVSLTFGTRATFDGVTIGTISCDATALSRGTTVCP